MKLLLLVSLALFLFGCASTQNDEKLGYMGQTKNIQEKSNTLETMQLLKSDPDVNFLITRGWTVASKNTDSEKAIWSFPPKEHEAYPSVVKREVTQIDGNIELITTI